MTVSMQYKLVRVHIGTCYNNWYTPSTSYSQHLAIPQYLFDVIHACNSPLKGISLVQITRTHTRPFPQHAPYTGGGRPWEEGEESAMAAICPLRISFNVVGSKPTRDMFASSGSDGAQNGRYKIIHSQEVRFPALMMAQISQNELSLGSICLMGPRLCEILVPLVADTNHSMAHTRTQILA